MDGARLQAARGYPLDRPGHPQGVSVDEHGPALGPIRFLTKTALGLVPRPIEELNLVFSHTFGQPLDCADLLPKLNVVARALNDGDRSRAMIATQLMRLPVLSVVEARRASTITALAKASPDDPEHPGWPGGTADGQGGEFRPKNGEAGLDAKKIVNNKTQRLLVRRAVRAGLRRILTGRRALRLTAEALSNAIPGLDVVGDVAMAADVTEMLDELATLKANTDVALDFVSKGPRTLEELQMAPEGDSFSSYNSFKKDDLVKRFGPAGDGYEYHHIVEQAGDGVSTSDIQSTKNIVRIPKLLHEEITSDFTRHIDGATTSIRDDLVGKSFDEKWQAGLQAMRNVGILW